MEDGAQKFMVKIMGEFRNEVTKRRCRKIGIAGKCTCLIKNMGIILTLRSVGVGRRD